MFCDVMSGAAPKSTAATAGGRGTPLAPETKKPAALSKSGDNRAITFIGPNRRVVNHTNREENSI